MKPQLFLLLFLIVSHYPYAQNSEKQIEVTAYKRTDRYREFSYVLGGRVSTDYVKMKGTSWGAGVNYKLLLNKQVFIKLGTGYYQYDFDEINGYNTMFGKNKVRCIGYPSPLYILFYTDRYRYHTLSLSLGAEKLFAVSKSLCLTTGLDFHNYFTFSQSYHISYNNPNNPIVNPYRLYDKRFFGLSTTARAGFLIT